MTVQRHEKNKKKLFQIKTITEGFEDVSKGTFYVVADLTDDQETELKSVGAFMENSDKYSSSANVYQQWPVGRGVFVADDKSVVININGEDHVKFISTENGKDFGKNNFQLQNYRTYKHTSDFTFHR